MKHSPRKFSPKSECLGKHRHRTRGNAEAEARKCGVMVDDYRCTHCGGWHVGHSSGAALKRMFQR